MKRRLLAVLLLAGGSLFAEVSFGLRIGPPPPPRVVRVRPVRPAPDYVWVDGYWYPVGNRYRWHNGYWTRPPYPGARWLQPRYESQRYFDGRWEGDRGQRDHDHRRDRDGDRDWDRAWDRRR